MAKNFNQTFSPPKQGFHGAFVISLDFELLWGLLDLENPMKYEKAIDGGRKAVYQMLELFQSYNIHATWGIVGLMTRNSIEECMAHQPNVLPCYTQPQMSAYTHLSQLSNYSPKLLFASDIIKHIAMIPFQEIGSHTYSHYYCLEDGQNRDSFRSELNMARNVTCQYNKGLRSIILPRNQFNPLYADILKESGFKNYRGTEKTWFYTACDRKRQKSIIRRSARILDNYLNIAGYHCYDYSEVKDVYGLNNLRSSRYFRPYSERLSFLEPLRMRRIKNQVKYAAINNKIFHMWWHPYSIGNHTAENISILEEIMLYYQDMHKRYNMNSYNMGELGEMLET